MPEFHKYTISKKGFWRKSFEIYEDDHLIYTVSCPGWLSYNHIIFNDEENKVALLIEKLPKLFQYKYQLLLTGGVEAELTKVNLSHQYTLSSALATYHAEGNWTGKEYTIYLGEDDIAKVSRKIWSDKDKYGIAIIEGHHNLLILGMVISIELIHMANQGS